MPHLLDLEFWGVSATNVVLVSYASCPLSTFMSGGTIKVARVPVVQRDGSRARLRMCVSCFGVWRRDRSRAGYQSWFVGVRALSCVLFGLSATKIALIWACALHDLAYDGAIGIEHVIVRLLTPFCL